MPTSVSCYPNDDDSRNQLKELYHAIAKKSRRSGQSEDLHHDFWAKNPEKNALKAISYGQGDAVYAKNIALFYIRRQRRKPRKIEKLVQANSKLLEIMELRIRNQNQVELRLDLAMAFAKLEQYLLALLNAMEERNDA